MTTDGRRRGGDAQRDGRDARRTQERRRLLAPLSLGSKPVVVVVVVVTTPKSVRATRGDRVEQPRRDWQAGRFKFALTDDDDSGVAAMGHSH